ncbi:unnamed protein product [Zymoseptoria tritici ST99CH_1A5]|uniref:Uncharacterized protein n=1 Tax=Zymoseptoria tritici ST99CH_1A5 TaxID=1276529 RepID=A0A1Y6M3H4_ZYMTR|nr:unnamed protein product [Zymoseptoria tritici ST99CH_1A5]
MSPTAPPRQPFATTPSTNAYPASVLASLASRVGLARGGLIGGLIGGTHDETVPHRVLSYLWYDVFACAGGDGRGHSRPWLAASPFRRRSGHYGHKPIPLRRRSGHHGHNLIAIRARPRPPTPNHLGTSAPLRPLQLVRDQCHEIQGLMNQLSSREAALLSSRRSRREYVSDEDLAELSGFLDLDAVKELLQKKDQMLAAKLGQLRNETMGYPLDRRTGYLHLRRLEDDAGRAARGWKSLLCLSIFVVVVVLSVPWQTWFGRHDEWRRGGD